MGESIDPFQSMPSREINKPVTDIRFTQVDGALQFCVVYADGTQGLWENATGPDSNNISEFKRKKIVEFGNLWVGK